MADMDRMTRVRQALRTWWDEQGYAWEVLMRQQAPWEQEGPLRWQRRLGSGWELHGATLPTEPVGQRPE
jgi:hypothetical protein